MPKRKVRKQGWKIEVELWDCDKYITVLKKHLEKIIRRGLMRVPVYYTGVKFKNLKIRRIK